MRPCSATASGSVSAAARIDTPSGTRRSSSSWTRTNSANAPWNSPTPGLARPEHSCGRPARQYSHSPQRCDGPPTAASPADHRVTSSPTATTRPEYSCPPIEPGAPQPSTKCAGRCRTRRSGSPRAARRRAELRDRALLDRDVAGPGRPRPASSPEGLRPCSLTRMSERNRVRAGGGNSQIGARHRARRAAMLASRSRHWLADARRSERLRKRDVEVDLRIVKYQHPARHLLPDRHRHLPGPDRIALFLTQLEAAKCPQVVGLQESGQRSVRRADQEAAPVVSASTRFRCRSRKPSIDKELVFTTLAGQEPEGGRRSPADSATRPAWSSSRLSDRSCSS